MNSKSLLSFWVIVLLLSGCNWFGTKLIYRTDADIPKPEVIGYSQLAFEDELVKVFDSTAVLFERTMAVFLDESEIESKKIVVNGFQGFETINPAMVRRICKSENMDGILFTELRFLNIDIRTMEMPTNVYADSRVEMQYYNKEGELLIHVRFSTELGKSYMSPPPASRIVPDATEGVLKKFVTQFR